MHNNRAKCNINVQKTTVFLPLKCQNSVKVNLENLFFESYLNRCKIFLLIHK